LILQAIHECSLSYLSFKRCCHALSTQVSSSQLVPPHLGTLGAGGAPALSGRGGSGAVPAAAMTKGLADVALHVIQRSLYPRFSKLTASYDVASNRFNFWGRQWLQSIQGAPQPQISLHAPPPCVRAYYFPDTWPLLGGAIVLHAHMLGPTLKRSACVALLAGLRRECSRGALRA